VAHNTWKALFKEILWLTISMPLTLNTLRIRFPPTQFHTLPVNCHPPHLCTIPGNCWDTHRSISRYDYCTGMAGGMSRINTRLHISISSRISLPGVGTFDTPQANEVETYSFDCGGFGPGICAFNWASGTLDLRVQRISYYRPTSCGNCLCSNRVVRRNVSCPVKAF
jgi:hypothetical protein